MLDFKDVLKMIKPMMTEYNVHAPQVSGALFFIRDGKLCMLCTTAHFIFEVENFPIPEQKPEFYRSFGLDQIPPLQQMQFYSFLNARFEAIPSHLLEWFQTIEERLHQPMGETPPVVLTAPTVHLTNKILSCSEVAPLEQMRFSIVRPDNLENQLLRLKFTKKDVNGMAQYVCKHPKSKKLFVAMPNSDIPCEYLDQALPYMCQPLKEDDTCIYVNVVMPYGKYRMDMIHTPGLYSPEDPVPIEMKRSYPFLTVEEPMMLLEPVDLDARILFLCTNVLRLAFGAEETAIFIPTDAKAHPSVMLKSVGESIATVRMGSLNRQYKYQMR